MMDSNDCERPKTTKDKLDYLLNELESLQNGLHREPLRQESRLDYRLRPIEQAIKETKKELDFLAAFLMWGAVALVIFFGWLLSLLVRKGIITF